MAQRRNRKNSQRNAPRRAASAGGTSSRRGRRTGTNTTSGNSRSSTGRPNRRNARTTQSEHPSPERRRRTRINPSTFGENDSNGNSRPPRGRRTGGKTRRTNDRSRNNRINGDRFDKAKKARRIAFAQNFLKNPALVRRLIRGSAIKEDSLVVEIGPGRGIITEQLAKVARSVIAVERDEKLFTELNRKFADNPKVVIRKGDYNARREKARNYIIFSNPPFNAFSKIVQKVIWADPLPEYAYLFAQRQAANRFCGFGKDYVYKILTAPWLKFDIVHKFERTDFSPAPRVDVVLLRISAKKQPLLPRSQQESYTAFVQFGYRYANEEMGEVYKRVFTPKQWSRLSKDLKLEPEARARHLTPDQWIQLFNFYKSRVDPSKRTLRR